MAEPAAGRGLPAHWWRARPSWLARLLQPLSWLYGLLAAAHAGVYRSGLRAVPALPVPVVVVGNLIVGGAGKTPTVIALLERLRALGFHPGVISRGYGREGRETHEVDRGASAASCGDEPLLIHLRTGAPVVVGADRVAAARLLLRRHPQVDLIVSDDGLQHRRLRRDLALIVFDERGTGNGLLLPAGPMRAPLPARTPPATLVLYNAPEPSTPLPGSLLRRRLAGAASLADWRRGAAPDPAVLASLCGRRVLAVAGIASPERFFSMLEAQQLTIERLPLPDHHDYRALPWPEGTADVALTEKDAVKLDPTRTGAARVWVVTLDFTFEQGFDAQLGAALEPLRKAPR